MKFKMQFFYFWKKKPIFPGVESELLGKEVTLAWAPH